MTIGGFGSSAALTKKWPKAKHKRRWMIMRIARETAERLSQATFLFLLLDHFR